MEIFKCFKRTALPFWWITFARENVQNSLFLQFLQLTFLQFTFFFSYSPLSIDVSMWVFLNICIYIGFYKIYIL